MQVPETEVSPIISLPQDIEDFDSLKEAYRDILGGQKQFQSAFNNHSTQRYIHSGEDIKYTSIISYNGKKRVLVLTQFRVLLYSVEELLEDKMQLETQIEDDSLNKKTLNGKVALSAWPIRTFKEKQRKDNCLVLAFVDHDLETHQKTLCFESKKQVDDFISQILDAQQTIQGQMTYQGNIDAYCCIFSEFYLFMNQCFGASEKEIRQSIDEQLKLFGNTQGQIQTIQSTVFEQFKLQRKKTTIPKLRYLDESKTFQGPKLEFNETPLEQAQTQCQSDEKISVPKLQDIQNMELPPAFSKEVIREKEQNFEVKLMPKVINTSSAEKLKHYMTGEYDEDQENEFPNSTLDEREKICCNDSCISLSSKDKKSEEYLGGFNTKTSYNSSKFESRMKYLSPNMKSALNQLANLPQESQDFITQEFMNKFNVSNWDKIESLLDQKLKQFFKFYISDFEPKYLNAKEDLIETINAINEVNKKIIVLEKKSDDTPVNKEEIQQYFAHIMRQTQHKITETLDKQSRIIVKTSKNRRQMEYKTVFELNQLYANNLVLNIEYYMNTFQLRLFRKAEQYFDSKQFQEQNTEIRVQLLELKEIHKSKQYEKVRKDPLKKAPAIQQGKTPITQLKPIATENKNKPKNLGPRSNSTQALLVPVRGFQQQVLEKWKEYHYQLHYGQKQQPTETRKMKHFETTLYKRHTQASKAKSKSPNK